LKMIVRLVWQHEHVRSRRQHASGNLNGLAKGDSGCLIRLVCACNGQNDQDCQQKQHGDKTRYDSGSLHHSSCFEYCGQTLLAIHFCTSRLTAASKFFFRQIDTWLNDFQNAYDD
jgi:hypothetical protein